MELALLGQPLPHSLAAFYERASAEPHPISCTNLGLRLPLSWLSPLRHKGPTPPPRTAFNPSRPVPPTTPPSCRNLEYALFKTLCLPPALHSCPPPFASESHRKPSWQPLRDGGVGGGVRVASASRLERRRPTGATGRADDDESPAPLPREAPRFSRRRGEPFREPISA